MWNTASNLYLHPLQANPDPPQSNLGCPGRKQEQLRRLLQRLRIQKTEVSLSLGRATAFWSRDCTYRLQSGEQKTRLVVAFQPLGSGTPPMNTPSDNRVKSP